jgi:rod shape determining protein RodA
MSLSLVRQHVRRMNWGLFAGILCLTALGVLFIYSASYRGDGLPISSFYKKQMVWLAMGISAYFLAMAVDYHRLSTASWWIYALGILLLVLVLLFGTKMYGATRWLDVGPLNIQPSEFAKLATVVALAHFLSRPGRDVRRPRCLVHALLITALPFLLILKEPDLGTAAVLLPTAVLILYAAGVPLKYLALLGAVALMLLPLGWLVLDDYQKTRLLVFVDPARDPLGAGWNKIQSEIAVGSGGLTGKGYLKGTQNVLGFLPRTVAPTDFIFPVIAEEMGFVGSALVMSLYAAVIIGIMRAAIVARDKLGRLLCVGIAAVLFSHVFVNIAMTVGFMPITGLPLPLISYGGSFTIITMMGLGLVQSVYVRRYRR